MSKSIVLVGGSGHAKVIMDVIRSSGGEIFGILDDGISAGTQVLGVPVLGKTDEYEKYNSHPFLIAVGNNEITAYFKVQNFVRTDFALLNKPLPCNYDKKFPLGVMPMLSFCYSGF